MSHTMQDKRSIFSYRLFVQPSGLAYCNSMGSDVGLGVYWGVRLSRIVSKPLTRHNNHQRDI